MHTTNRVGRRVHLLLALCGALLAPLGAGALTLTGSNQPGEGKLFLIPVAANATNLAIRITNSAATYSHLYLRAGATAATNEFDFVSRLSAGGVAMLNLERPEFVTGTNYALWVQTPTNSAAHGFTVVVDFNRIDARRASMPVMKRTAMDVAGVANPGETNFFQVDVSTNLPGWRLVLAGTGSADPDIALQRGALPGGQSLKSSSGRRLDTLFLPSAEAVAGTYFVAVSVPGTDLGNSTFSLRSEIQPLLALDWDPGLQPEPTEVRPQPSAIGGDYFFKVVTTNAIAGLWRTRLTVLAGDADLYLKQGALPTETAKDFASTRAGSDGVALSQSGQFSSGQTWYLMVLAQPGAEWRLSSGSGYIPTLAPPGGGAEGGTNDLFTVEGINFYRTTIPSGTLAWRLTVNGLTNQVLVNRDRVAHPLASPRPDWSLPGQLLLVPPYLKAGTEYFISVMGTPGDPFNLDSRPHPVTDLALDASTEVSSTNQFYLTFRVALPAEQVGWQVAMSPTEGDPHLAVRDAFVGNEYINTAYLEMTNRTEHLVTLVPPVLHDGMYYLTVYGRPPFTAQLSNRRPPVIYVPYRFELTNAQPAQAGWRYYGVTNIEDQAASLGWELLLRNQLPGTELALRRNRAPSSWQYRSNVVQSTVSATPLARSESDYLSTNGFLQRPQHAADIWYVGVRHPDGAAGPFVLTGRDIPVTPVDFGADFRTAAIRDLVPGYVQYFRVIVPENALAFEARLAGVTSGAPRLVVARDLLPLSQRSQLAGGAVWASPNTSTNWPSGAQIYNESDWTGFTSTSAGTNEPAHYFFAGRGNPLVTGTYHVGIFTGTGVGATNRINADLLLRGLFAGSNVVSLPFGAGQASSPPLRAHDTAWYRVDVPAGQPSWKIRVQMPTNQEGMLLLRQTGVASYAAGSAGPTNVAGTRLRKNGDEQFLLLPNYPATSVPAGVYHVGLLSEGQSPSGSRAGSNTCVLQLTSEGPLVLQDLSVLDPLGATSIVATAKQAGGEVKGYRFTVRDGTPAIEIRLKDRVGNPRMALRADGQLPVLSDNYGYNGGAPATWADDDFIRIPSPAAGEYSLLIQAAGSGATYPEAGYTLEITAQGGHPLAFDRGVYTVTNQLATGWEYFRVVVPTNAMGWDLRFLGLTKGDPRLVVCRESVPTSLTTRTASGLSWSPFAATNWPVGAQVAPDRDWTGYGQSADGTNQIGQVLSLAMGNPLEPGVYVIGVTGGGTPGPTNVLAYQISSRGIGTNMAIPIVSIDYAGGVGVVDAAPPRETSYFKVTIPDATPSWQLRLEASLGDSLLVLRRGGLPNFGAAVGTLVTNLAGCLLQRSNDEHFVLLPFAPATNLPSGDYYFGVISEGVQPAAGKIGSGTSSARLRSRGELVPLELGTVDETSRSEIRVTNRLDGGELASYRFTVKTGTVAVVVRLDNREGNPVMNLRSGDGIPRSSEVYGRQGGWAEDFKDPAYIRLPASAGGTYQLVVQAGSVSGRYEPAQYTLRVYSLVVGTIPLVFDGGTVRIRGHTSKEWLFFSVDVPAEAMGWDLRLTDVAGGDSAMVICRDDYPRALSSSFSWSSSTNWPAGGQVLPGVDWTGYKLNPDQTKAENKIFAAGMGAPLGPGRYIIGVTSADAKDERDLAYTITSRGIGTGFRVPVQVLASGSSTQAVPVLPPREAAYFQMDLPDETPGWKLRLRTTRGDSLLAVRRGGLPNLGALSQSLASALAGGHKLQKPGDEHLLFGPVAGTETVPAGRYYLAVVGEGEGPNSGTSVVGTNWSEATLESRLPSPPLDLGFVTPGGVDRLLTNSLASGETAAYRFTLPSGSLGLEVTLDAPTGSPLLRLRNDGLPPLDVSAYGQDGGFKGLWEGTRRLALVSPTSGVYQLTVQAGASNSVFAGLDYVLRLHAESRVSILSFDGGRAGVTNQAVDLWKTFLVEVPAQAIGWDLRLTDVKSGDPRLVIRREEVPVDLHSRDELYQMTNWPSGWQLAPAGDWTGRDAADGSSSQGRVFQAGLGNPLSPGIYYVGITNLDSHPATYTLVSRGIGTSFTIPVRDLAFEAGFDGPTLEPREAAWYRVQVPTNAPAWKLRLLPEVGEALLVAQQGVLPNVRPAPTNNLHRLQGGRLLRKSGAEQLLCLPPGGTNNLLPGGTYYLGVVSEGMVASNNVTRLGTNFSVVSLWSEGAPRTVDLGRIETNEIVVPVALAGGESGTWQFQIPDGTRAFEVWTRVSEGSPFLTLAPGDSPPGGTNVYGVNGGAPWLWQSGSVITLPNPVSTNYALTVQAGARTGTFPDARFEIHARALRIDDLAFDAALAGNGRSSVVNGTIEEDHRVYFRVEVPADVRGEPVIGWRLTLQATHGKPTLRVRPQVLPDDSPDSDGSRPVQRQAVLVPGYLTPGVWYVEVQAGGLTAYTLASEALRLDRPAWTMPAPGDPVTTPGLPANGTVFGDSGIGPDGVALPGLYVDLEQDSFHYYAIRVPERNQGLLRTDLIAYNGDPNLYLRRGTPPSIAGRTFFDRALTNAVGTEYGSWVPLDGRTETRLAPGLWYLAVHAAGGSNVRYRLQAAVDEIMEVPFISLGATEPRVLAAGDWQYYRVALPLNMPDAWDLTLNQIAGDVVLHLRDGVPPGHGTSGGQILTWRDDAKNHGPYPASYPPGTQRLSVPPLRPGATYYLGVRAVTDARFSVFSAPAGAPIALTGVLPFAGGQASETLRPGDWRRYRIDTPSDARWFKLTTISPASVRYFLDQGSVPTVTSADHWASTVANPSVERALYDNAWPWMAGVPYFLTVTNLSTNPQTFSFRLDGRDCSDDDFDQDGLPDCWETTWFGSIYTYGPESDPDGDGVGNLDEYRSGSDPTSAGTGIEFGGIGVGADGRIVFEVRGGVGRTVRIQASASPGAGEWVNVLEFVPTEASQSVVLPAAESAAAWRFFRLVSP